MCNCKKKVINNLDIPHYVRLAKELWGRLGAIPFEQLTEDNWVELYMIYNQIYPNSNGQPSKEELLQIIHSASQRKG